MLSALLAVAALVFAQPGPAEPAPAEPAPAELAPAKFGPAELGPVQFGRARLAAELAARGLAAELARIDVTIGGGGSGDEPRESFTIETRGERIVIAAPDATGAMYGELELAERVAENGAAALMELDVRAKPDLEVRAINPFLTLPWDSEKNEPIHDAAALGDPTRWWFHDEDYWTTLFDLMAEARLNQLDLHGTYDIDTTRFPNLYAYFVDSPSFPEVGISKELKATNLAQLAHVIELAHARGVKVSVMSYEAQFYTPHNPKPPYESSEANLAKYTREVVEAMIRALPELDAIGFRIGESGHGAEFFNCYLEAVKASGRDIPLYTRSWITRKQVVVPLACASKDFTVEIKFNGEQWGPHYPIAGGRVPGWHSYSFEDYLSDSNVSSAARLWPGNVTANGERWPDEPYKIVWQVRANGTHRIFPFYEPDWVRRTVESMPLGTARGFSVECFDSYFPPTPRYYLADPKDQWCKWIHQRDALWLIQWGRLGYDPKTPESVFERAIERHLGREIRALAAAWKSASRIVPTFFSAYSFGPDHRDHAPELEWGGDIESFIQTEPFDSHVFRSVKETLAYAATGGLDGRLDAWDVSKSLEQLAQNSETALLQRSSPAAHEIFHAIEQERALARYSVGRLRGALSVAAFEAGAERGVLALGATDMERACGAWAALSDPRIGRFDCRCTGPDDSPRLEHGFYRPFPDTLRMRTRTFHWKDSLELIEREAERIAALAGDVVPAGTSHSLLRTALREPNPRWSSDVAGKLTCFLQPTIGEFHVRRAWLLHKPLPSSTFFHKVPMALDGESKTFTTSLQREPGGHLLAAEVEIGRNVVRVPFGDDGPPYLVVPAQSGPTPQYYSSQEALTYLRPESLDPAKHGMLLIATRAWDFHRGFDVGQQRKLLDAVARGMKLVVLQQDYASGRYPLDWFPKRPKIESAATNVFDPAGALGLEKVETDGVLWQPIRASDGWEVFGNGGIARCKLGEGEIWLCQARLIQRMHIPGCARNLKKLLELGGREKPVVVIDAGSEGNRFATSVFCDFMNAHDIPFLTLGEVIVAEQGMDSFTRVPGVASLERVLEGRGGAMVADWLARKMRAACDRPVPPTREAFEVERARRKREFLRSIGLDPLPPRTPLNARITGTLQRDGYRIEKLVFESRPGMPVTAHLYVPDGLVAGGGAKLPVIVNPNGHWQHKKSEPTVQARLIHQVKHGYLALAVDSPGHSFEGDAKIERRGAGTHFDPRLIAGSTTADTIFVWDLMRALDYLETRPEADMTRVGITGTSGGGHATMFAFAADERFACAVPCCYPSSFLDGWDNGCDCNHVPGYVQVGDRADVLGIRAPAPVFVIGATDDDEFPARGTQRTGEKLAAQWKLFGAEERAWCRLFEGGHDSSQPMREAALGFFDLHLKGVGDGSPVPEAPAETAEPEDPALVCLVDPPAEQTTMRDVARANAARAGDVSFEDVVALNGGLPERTPVELHFLPPIPGESGRAVTFESEPGLTIPGIYWGPEQPKVAIVLVSEHGKHAAREEFGVDELVAAGYGCLAIDVRGFGELPGLDPKLMSYLGIADSFAMGFDAARAAQALLPRAELVAIWGKGPCGSLVALYGGLIEPRAFIAGEDALASWSELFDDSIPTYTLQPRVGYGASLERLRELAGARVLLWKRRGERVDGLATIDALAGSR
ncbi:MAG: acetylxylan esterase [Planctomycetes bacterium]|nr:acetylxylan esterase [Planctomycetota bacterium]